MNGFLDDYNQPRIQITVEGHRMERTIDGDFSKQEKRYRKIG